MKRSLLQGNNDSILLKLFFFFELLNLVTTSIHKTTNYIKASYLYKFAEQNFPSAKTFYSV